MSPNLFTAVADGRLSASLLPGPSQTASRRSSMDRVTMLDPHCIRSWEENVQNLVETQRRVREMERAWQHRLRRSVLCRAEQTSRIALYVEEALLYRQIIQTNGVLDSQRAEALAFDEHKGRQALANEQESELNRFQQLWFAMGREVERRHVAEEQFRLEAQWAMQQAQGERQQRNLQLTELREAESEMIRQISQQATSQQKPMNYSQYPQYQQQAMPPPLQSVTDPRQLPSWDDGSANHPSSLQQQSMASSYHSTGQQYSQSTYQQPTMTTRGMGSNTAPPSTTRVVDPRLVEQLAASHQSEMEYQRRVQQVRQTQLEGQYSQLLEAEATIAAQLTAQQQEWETRQRHEAQMRSATLNVLNMREAQLREQVKQQQSDQMEYQAALRLQELNLVKERETQVAATVKEGRSIRQAQRAAALEELKRREASLLKAAAEEDIRRRLGQL